MIHHELSNSAPPLYQLQSRQRVARLPVGPPENGVATGGSPRGRQRGPRRVQRLAGRGGVRVRRGGRAGRDGRAAPRQGQARRLGHRRHVLLPADDVQRREPDRRPRPALDPVLPAPGRLGIRPPRPGALRARHEPHREDGLPLPRRRRPRVRPHLLPGPRRRGVRGHRRPRAHLDPLRHGALRRRRRHPHRRRGQPLAAVPRRPGAARQAARRGGHVRLDLPQPRVPVLHEPVWDAGLPDARFRRGVRRAHQEREPGVAAGPHADGAVDDAVQAHARRRHPDQLPERARRVPGHIPRDAGEGEGGEGAGPQLRDRGRGVRDHGRHRVPDVRGGHVQRDHKEPAAAGAQRAAQHHHHLAHGVYSRHQVRPPHGTGLVHHQPLHLVLVLLRYQTPLLPRRHPHPPRPQPRHPLRAPLPRAHPPPHRRRRRSPPRAARPAPRVAQARRKDLPLPPRAAHLAAVPALRGRAGAHGLAALVGGEHRVSGGVLPADVWREGTLVRPRFRLVGAGFRPVCGRRGDGGERD